MTKKQLKPPYYRVTAECHIHGTVHTERKPHPKTGQRLDTGGIQRPEPIEIVCPHCTYHAKVTHIELVTAQAE